MRVRKFAFVISAAFAILGLVAFVQILRGHANMGVDFSGGALLQYKAEKPFALDEVRTALQNNGHPGVDLQEVTGENRLIIKIKKSEEKVGNLDEQITSILHKEQSDKGFFMESKSEIGSSTSADLRNKAIIAVVISMVGVMLYLALRFDFRFGLAAAAATFHDVLAVLGIFWLLDKEMTLLTITALLTLAGYSLNDTVVIFDRIRENMQKDETLSLYENINTSTNQVLARSIITVLTVFFTVAALFFFGGSAIHDFSLTLMIGLIVGSFSSIFVASPLLSIGGKHNV